MMHISDDILTVEIKWNSYLCGYIYKRSNIIVSSVSDATSAVRSLTSIFFNMIRISALILLL